MKTIQHKTFRDYEIVVSDTPRKINSYGIVLDLTEAEAEKLAKVAGFVVMADPSDEDEPAEAEVDSTEDGDEAGDEEETSDTGDEKPVARSLSAKKRGRPTGRRGK
jgi:hypothetical protein